MSEILVNIARESWFVLGEMAPYLLFGFLVAGILSVCISPPFIERHLGGRGFGPVLKASLLGIPLPLCSCGVIPVTASFRRHGASRGATTSFLLSTPQTGVDSILITYALLGLVFAAFRPVAAMATGLIGGLLVMLFAQSGRDNGEPTAPRCAESCCADRKEHKHNVVWRALEYGFVTLPRDIGLPLLLGVGIAGAIAALTSPDQWGPYLGSGVLSIIVVMALGVPIYVCATASVPIAAGLIHLGASPGAALAFLIAGPATNAATITTLWKLLGKRSAALYLLTIGISAVAGGLTLDWLILATGTSVPQLAAHHHDTPEGLWLSAFWAVLLLVVLGVSYAARHHPTAEYSTEDDPDATQPRERITLAVDGMTCDHCMAAVTQALDECHGTASVKVDLAAGQAVVVGDRLDALELVAAVNALGYHATKLEG